MHLLSFTHRYFKLSSFLLLLVPLLVYGNSINPENRPSKTVNFNLPQQPLSSGLLEFALQTNTLVFVEHSLVKGVYSEALRGHFSIDNAIEKLLAKSNLTYNYDHSYQRIFIYEKKLDETMEPDGTQPLLEEMVVTANRLPFRYQTLTHSQIHSHLTHYDNARFLVALPEQLKEDQLSTSLVDFIKSSSAITPADGIADTNDDFYIRGFPRNAIYLDDFRLDSNLGNKLMPIMYQSVEILKGPSTLKYGQAEPGGVVNVVRKRPEKGTPAKVQLNFGSDHRKETYFIWGGPVNKHENADISLGITAGYQDVPELKNLSDIKRTMIMPSANISFGYDKHLELSYLGQKSEQINDQNSIIVSPDGARLNLISSDSKLPKSREDFEAELGLFSMTYTQQFGSNWHGQLKVFGLDEERFGVRGNSNLISGTSPLININSTDPELSYILFAGAEVAWSQDSIIQGGINQAYEYSKLRSIYDEYGRSKSSLLKAKIEGSIDFTSFTHHITMGLDRYTQKNIELVSLEERNDIDRIILSSDGSTNALDEVHIEFRGYDGSSERESYQQALYYVDYGAYLQNTIELSRSLLFSFGSRYIYTEGSLNANSGPREELTNYKEYASQVGLVYKPIVDTSLYLSFSEGMRPNYLIDDVGTNITEPERSEQLELGIKWLGFNGKLLSTAALYSIDKENIVDINIHPQTRQRIADVSSEQTVEGVDIDLTASFGERLNITGAFSFLESTVVAGAFKDLEPPLVASFTTSLFANYLFNSGLLDGLSINFGGYHVGDRYADMENTVVLDSFSIFDVGASYRSKADGRNFSMQLKINNILDQQYFDSVESGVRANRGLGRTAIYSFSVEL